MRGPSASGSPSPPPGAPGAGLTASPAVWISLYYVAFYVVMSGIFALCIYVLMRTIDPYTPDYQDQLKSPGKPARGRRARGPSGAGPGRQPGPKHGRPSAPEKDGPGSRATLPPGLGMRTRGRGSVGFGVTVGAAPRTGPTPGGGVRTGGGRLRSTGAPLPRPQIQSLGVLSAVWPLSGAVSLGRPARAARYPGCRNRARNGVRRAVPAPHSERGPGPRPFPLSEEDKKTRSFHGQCGAATPGRLSHSTPRCFAGHQVLATDQMWSCQRDFSTEHSRLQLENRTELAPWSGGKAGLWGRGP